METKTTTIFDYIGQMFCFFGITMIVMMGLTFLFGESAQEISTMFLLGSGGITLATMGQFFLVSVLSTVYRAFFFSNFIFKKMSTFIRTICMVSAVVLTIAVFVLLFDWFPVNMWQPWAMFLLCFGLCFVVSMGVMFLKTNMENKKMEEGLERIKKQWKEEEDGKGI